MTGRSPLQGIGFRAGPLVVSEPRTDSRTGRPLAARLLFRGEIPLALDDDLAVQCAGFDLANVAARAVNLLGDQGRALRAAARSALRNVAASVDANGCRRGIEIGLQHNYAVGRARSAQPIASG